MKTITKLNPTQYLEKMKEIPVSQRRACKEFAAKGFTAMYHDKAPSDIYFLTDMNLSDGEHKAFLASIFSNQVVSARKNSKRREELQILTK